jgi:hypothetical protein
MIHIQRNSDGSFQTDRTTHTANLVCDGCGTVALGVDMNANAQYGADNTTIHIYCSTIGGSCNSSTGWPTIGGTADAQELALVKTA